MYSNDLNRLSTPPTRQFNATTTFDSNGSPVVRKSQQEYDSPASCPRNYHHLKAPMKDYGCDEAMEKADIYRNANITAFRIQDTGAAESPAQRVPVSGFSTSMSAQFGQSQTTVQANQRTNFAAAAAGVNIMQFSSLPKDSQFQFKAPATVNTGMGSGLSSPFPNGAMSTNGSSGNPTARKSTGPIVRANHLR